MKNCFKSIFLILLIGLGALVVMSCSSENESRNESTKKESSFNKAILEKKWVVTHFNFKENVNSSSKFKYQIANIHIELSKNIFNASDHYSLYTDKGNWTLDTNVITMNSNNENSIYKFKIVELKENYLIVDVLNHKELEQIELVPFN